MTSAAEHLPVQVNGPADRVTRHSQIGQVLQTWDPEDVERLQEMLAKFNLSIESLEGQPWPRPRTRSGGHSS